MSARHLPKIALALLTLVACSTRGRASAKDTVTARASADTASVSTHRMIEALERDRSASDRDLAATEDSIYLFMGDTVATLLKQAHASWEQYRRLECDAIRVAFAEGSMAPVAHLECWVDLADDHRKFMAQEYDYMRHGGPPPVRPPR